MYKESILLQHLNSNLDIEKTDTKMANWISQKKKVILGLLKPELEMSYGSFLGEEYFSLKED